MPSDWIPDLDATPGAKYQAIADALGSAIGSGALRPGERLPPQRQLAETLGVDLATVTRALAEAQRRGLVDASPGRGTFVRAPVGSPASALADLAMNSPPQPAGLAAKIGADLAKLLGTPGAGSLLHYQDAGGIEAHRAAGAHLLGRRLPGLSAARTVVVPGAQAALAMLLRLMPEAKTMAAGWLTYPGAKAAAAAAGLRIAPLAIDAGGIDPDSFAALCRQAPPDLLYLVPALDSPTTATLSAERRRAIADIATRYGVTVAEDDAYGLTADTSLPPIASLTEHGWQIATLAKCVSPALRIAYVAAPDADAAGRFASVLHGTALMASPLASALAARWIESGTLDAITAEIVAENRARHAIAAKALDGLTFASDPNASHLWLTLPPHWTRAEFVAHGLRAGLSVVPSDAFATDGAPEEAVRLSMGVIADRGDLAAVLARLRELIDRRAPSSMIV